MPSELKPKRDGRASKSRNPKYYTPVTPERDADGKIVHKTRTPAHGKGKLRVGNPGNKGGGKPPNKIREELRGIVDERLVKEIKRRLGPKNIRKLSDDELVKYLDGLSKYGLGSKVELAGPDDGPISHGVLVIGGIPTNGAEELPAGNEVHLIAPPEDEDEEAPT
jgi:hypothetical protein